MDRDGADASWHHIYLHGKQELHDFFLGHLRFVSRHVLLIVECFVYHLRYFSFQVPNSKDLLVYMSL